MKKLFLTLCLLATGVATWADLWTAPISTTYPNETPLYVTVTVNEQADTYVPAISEIAAFIDGECRAQATGVNDYGFYELRVRGSAADMGKTITIKAVYNNLAYVFDHTETFDGETQTHDVPLALTLSPLLGVGFDENPINVVLNGTYNLANHLAYTFGSAAQGAEDATIDQTTTPLTVTYSAGNYISTFTVSDAGVLTAVSQGSGVVTVSVKGPAFESGTAQFQGRATVNVSLPPVTQIVVNPTELTVYVGDNLNTLIQNGTLSISMLPAEADQSYSFTTSEPSLPWDGNYNFNVSGDFTVQVNSTSNGNLTPVTLTIHVKEHLSFILERGAYEGAVGMITPFQFKIYISTPEDFNASLLTIGCGSQLATDPFAYEFSTVKQEVSDGRTLSYVTTTLTGRYIGQWSYEVLYNGEPIADWLNVTVYPEIQIQNGWQWVSPYVYQEGSEAGDLHTADGPYQDWVTNYIVEIRSQEDLLYNDPTIGVFGDIHFLDFTTGMYKVKSKSTTPFVLTLGQPNKFMNWRIARDNDGPSLKYGYNWIVYPYEFALNFSEVAGSINPEDGDMIICKNGDFVEYDGNEWAGNAITFNPGEGYMYYYNGADNKQFNFYFNIYENIPACYDNAAPVKGEIEFTPRATAREMGWDIDASRFADNMCIVASIDLNQDSRYLFGAFVGDECRGTGSMVRDGIAFISAAGKSGEKVSFRLVDTQTGETFNINETMNFRLKAGSLKAPVSLTSEGVTGIKSVDNGQLTIDNAIYDLNGRRIERPTKGIYIVNGKKVVF